MIKVVGKPPLNFESDHLISQLYSYIEQDIIFYSILRETLMFYGESYLFDSAIFEDDIENYLANYPHLRNYNFEDFFKIVQSIFTIYYRNNEEEYKQFRGDFTEFLITKTGPYLSALPQLTNITSEATFYEDSQVIQPNSEVDHFNNVDVCFHTAQDFSTIEEVECEALECKIKIGNFLREKLLEEEPVRKKDRKDRNKIKYMESLGRYFQPSETFTIAFATLATNIDFPKKLLEQFPSTHIELVSSKMIENAIKKNQTA